MVLVNLDQCFNTQRPRQNGRHFADDTFKCIFLKENVWIPITIWLGFVPKGPINNIQALVQIMAWRRSGDKPLSETMILSLLTHICVTRPQWVKGNSPERRTRRTPEILEGVEYFSCCLTKHIRHTLFITKRIGYALNYGNVMAWKHCPYRWSFEKGQ